MPSKIVLKKRPRRTASAPQAFSFTPEMVPTGGALASYRTRAWDAFTSLPMPTPADEAWRRTDLRRMPAATFRLPDPESVGELPAPPAALLRPLIEKAPAGLLVLTPQGPCLELDSSLASQGVLFTDLRTAEREYPERLVQAVGEIVRPEEGKFAALAAALAQNGVFLYVPRGVHLEAPLHSVLWTPGVSLAHLSHLVIWVDEDASVTFVHEVASPEEEGDSLHAGILEVRVAASGRLRFVELQSLGRHVWNFTHQRVRLERDASLDWVFGAVGSRLSKDFLEVELVGPGASARASGFYFTDGRQHLDLDTQQNHLAPATTSDLLFKGALAGKSRAVWQGMIYVAPGAQKADGYQANRNLILSEEARADSIPGLEIAADDVRCTHGATVSKIEEEPLFYLRSRGIPRPEAERLLVEGFFDPIMQRIPFDGVRDRLREVIRAKILRR